MENVMTKKSSNGARVGVFLCQCGGKISSKVDLSALKTLVTEDPQVACVESLPFPCLAPGLGIIRDKVSEHGLDRLVVAGCEYRLMLKKFENEFLDMGLEQGQIDMVNLRGHVAAVNTGDPSELAIKGSKLIRSAVAGLAVLIPSPKNKVDFKDPVVIVGAGMATYAAASELSRHGVETIIAVQTEDIEDEIRMLHERYPGERRLHDRLRKIMEEVGQSPLVKQITVGELDKVRGVMGDYTVIFSGEGNEPPRMFKAGAIIAALDGEMQNQGSEFGHDGKRVLCHTEMEEHLWLHGIPDHRVLFWINDLETDRPYAHLSTRTAWNMATYMREHLYQSKVSILYNDKIKLPLSAAERIRARELNIRWIPYDGSVRPTVQSGFITCTDPETQVEREIPWDQLVLSPKRHPGLEQIKVAKALGLHIHGEDFLERNPQMVRPEQVGTDEKFLAGSARQPCDLEETLRQGRRAAKRIAEIVQRSEAGELYAPRMVCRVDQSKCIGCGLCHEICDCGGIAPVDGPGGNIPRVVDPMVCTGGGTCAAACPYHALELQNNTTTQREARVGALARTLKDEEVLAFGCNWGGAAAADNAGIRGMAYNERLYMLPVGCIGQLDPVVMGRAFLDGANSLLLVGCPPEECHHSYGLDHTWSRILLIKKLLSLACLERERICLAHTDLNRPERFIKTVNTFVQEMDRLGPITRDERMKAKIRDLYDTLKNPRVRWVLGASLRRPWETTYPADQRNALAYDETLSDVVTEEFIKTRIVNFLKSRKEVLNLSQIVQNLGEAQPKVVESLRDLSSEGIVSRIFKDRVPYYTMQ